MDTKRLRKLISQKITDQIERLESTKADLADWQPGDEWLEEDLMVVSDNLSEIAADSARGSVDGLTGADEEEEEEEAPVVDEEDEDDDGVDELDAELGFDDVQDQEDD